jgi:hypothetical protein
MYSPIITLTTDFGLRDSYVAEMKAVIASLSPGTLIIDVSHEVEKFNIRMGAFILAQAAPFFPKETVHLAVVDPEVGGQRKPIVIQTKNGFFVGPDNGVLMLAAQFQEIQKVHEITNPKFTLKRISNTFHGRDIFAPVAAHLAKKHISVEEIGPKVLHPLNPGFAKVSRRGNTLHGEVLHVDGFGNVITNVTEKDLPKSAPDLTVEVKTVSEVIELKLTKTYANSPAGELIALIDSHGYLELAMNKGNAARGLKLNPGEKIILKFCK